MRRWVAGDRDKGAGCAGAATNRSVRMRTKAALRRRILTVVGALAALAGLVAMWEPTADVVQTVLVGQVPCAIAVDAQIHRAFVANCKSATVSVLDTGTGALLRTVVLSQGVGDVAVDGSAQRLVVLGSTTTGAGLMRILDARTGTVLHTAHVGPDPLALGIDERAGHVFVLSFSPGSLVHEVTVLDLQSGAVVRTVPVGLNAQTLAVDAPTGHVFVPGSTLSITGVVHVLDARTGHVLRVVPVGRSPQAIAIEVRARRVFVANLNSGSVSVLDARSGALLHTINAGNYAVAIAVDSMTKRVFLANYGADGTDRTMSVLDSHNLTDLRTVTMEHGSAALAVDEMAGRIYVVNRTPSRAISVRAPGAVSVLDARNGTVLRTILVGVDPVAVAVDSQTRRVFVVNAAGAVSAPDAWGWVPPWLRRWVPFIPAYSSRTTSAPGSVSVFDAAHM